MIEEKVIKRGYIYYVNIPEDKNDPHKQTGCRPCIITSNDSNNIFSGRVHYIPLTTQLKKTNLPVHVVLKNTRLQKLSMALCESLDAIDKSCVLEKVGTVSSSDMFNIDLALMIQQGINIKIISNFKQYAYAI